MSDTEDERNRPADNYRADPLEVNRRIVDEYRANGGRVAQFGGPSRMPPS